MTSIVVQGLDERDARVKARLGALAYEHFQLSARCKAIEAEIGQLEVAQGANGMMRKDVETEAAIDAAKKETNG